MSSTSREGGITPLGGTRDAGSHKGYGLAVMVHILAGCLSGASFSPLRNRTQKPSDPHNIGHFFLAIDPRAFRGEGEFEDDLDQVIDVLRGAKRADPDQPVLIPGDPEMATRADRLAARRPGARRPDDAAPRRGEERRGPVRPRALAWIVRERHPRGGRGLSPRGLPATGCVTHSPASPLCERRAGLGGPTPPAAGSPRGATRPSPSAFMNNPG